MALLQVLAGSSIFSNGNLKQIHKPLTCKALCVFFSVGWDDGGKETQQKHFEQKNLCMDMYERECMYVYTQNPSLQIEDEPQSVPRSNTWLTSVCRVNGRRCEPT